ncbi:aspartate 1-decarboxylase [Moraxella catarrhalis]|uniref:Aspartate 1-decarboxylase n=1 Tax=Moraxella catarrhalis TaxID=480 RepID=A0A198UEC7_MORCA|nr:aspartate 1-decarboxylase [Moraxella catarrhalis]OAU94287.1 Aspartate 1-decarboxylase [Moraxella catarrhalis]OAU94745.1 Aspartate 1-decarboxylase [Moraxella catarrhalis]OAV04113.1 Aspartate 1-decarboxylase [Moraxella catarrhalis]
MIRTLLGGKIHRATVTQANLNYVGSITVDVDLLDAAGILVNEKVSIVNNNNGERFETYTISGERGSGVVCLNGAAARKVQPGDVIIIMNYLMMNDSEAQTHQPNVVLVDANNHITDVLHYEPANTVW